MIEIIAIELVVVVVLLCAMARVTGGSEPVVAPRAIDSHISHPSIR